MTVALPTREDYFQIGAQEVFARSAARASSQRISPEAVFAEGTDINIILAAQSAMADEATRHLALRMAALFLDSAEGEDLDRLVADRFSPTVVRRQAAPAVVQLQFTRTDTSAPVTFDVGAKFRTTTGTEFELAAAVAIPLGSSGPVTGVAQAVLAGTGGNAGANTITQFVTSPTDTTVVVTNLEPASGGTDVETDESLRERARDFFRTARRGTLSAIEFGALTVAGISSATAIEILDPQSGLPTGVVQVFIADQNGQSNQVLAESVRNALLEFRAAGVIVDVLTSQPSFQQIDYVIRFRDGTDTRAAADQLKAITVATVNVLAPGEPLLRSLLFSIARSIPGAIVPDDAIQTPAGDVLSTRNIGVAFKTELGLITVNGV